MSDNMQVINDQRSVNEPPKVFDSMESVDRRAIINTDTRRQFDQAKFPPELRFRGPDPNQQYQIWRQPVGRPPPGYPPPRFIPRNANEPRAFPPRNQTPLRTQEYQNRRSFEKPERPFDVDINLDNQSRPISPWQRIRERLPDARIALQSANQQQDMESLKMAFEERTNREPNKDRVPPVFRRDSMTNIDPRIKPVMERRFEDRDGYAQNERKPSIPPGEYIRREPNPDPRMQFDQNMRRPSLTQIQLNEQNYTNDRVPSPSVKVRPLHALPEYENRNQYPAREEDHNRNYRPDGYRDFRKLSDLENINRENRKFIATRPEEEHQQRVQEISRFNGYDPMRGRMELNLNKIDLNGTSDNRNGVRSTTNENKSIQDKKPTANGDIKPPSSLPALKKEKSALKTPTKKISPKTPETGSTNSLGEKKKISMNKVQVGSAPSPNLKVVRSKIGSLQNYTHKPGGGKVKIENRKLEWKAQPRIEAKNDTYAPSGGDKKITQVKLQWSAKSKIGSLENATHKPGGGDKKIESVKLDFKDKAKPKVGSKDNIKHVPGGGIVKKSTDADTKSISSDIEDQKLDIKAQSKIGSLDNVKHRPGGGDKKIFDDKEYLKQTNESSKANSVTTSGSQALEDSQQCSREVYKNEKPAKQTTLAEIDSPKKSDRAKVEKSPATEKKSEPDTPKKSLTKKEPTENKPTMLVDSTKNIAKLAQVEKTPQKEKIEPKLKTENEKSSKGVTVQPKTENVKVPSEENSKSEINLKNKSTPNMAVQKPALGADSKLISNTSTQNKSELKNSTESEKNKPKSESTEKLGATNQTQPKPTSVPVSKENIEKKSNLNNVDKQELKPIVDNKPNIGNATDSKPRIENKSNFSNADKQGSKPQVENKSKLSNADKQDLKPQAENKSNLSHADKQDFNPKEENLSNLTNVNKQDFNPKEENKSNISFNSKEQQKELNTQQPKPTSAENKSNLLFSNTKDQPKSSNNQDPKPPVKNTAASSDALEKNLLVQSIKPKDEPKSNLSSIDKEKNKTSNIQNLSKPIVENTSTIPIKTATNSDPAGDSKIKPILQSSQDVKSNLEIKKSEPPQISDIATKSKLDVETKFEKDEKNKTLTDPKIDQNKNKKSEPNTSISTVKEQSQQISTQEKISNIPTKEKETPSSFSSVPKTVITEIKFSEFAPKEVKPQNPSSELSQKQVAPVVALIPEQKK